MSVQIGGTSRAKGSVNEDAYLVDVDHVVFGVFDGLGATVVSVLAARLAAEAIRAVLPPAPRGGRGANSERAFLLLPCGEPGRSSPLTLEDGLTTASGSRCATPPMAGRRR